MEDETAQRTGGGLPELTSDGGPSCSVVAASCLLKQRRRNLRLALDPGPDLMDPDLLRLLLFAILVRIYTSAAAPASLPWRHRAPWETGGSIACRPAAPPSRPAARWSCPALSADGSSGVVSDLGHQSDGLTGSLLSLRCLLYSDGLRTLHKLE